MRTRVCGDGSVHGYEHRVLSAACIAQVNRGDGEEGKVSCLCNRNCLATTVEERVCRDQILLYKSCSLPPPQCFPLFKHRLTQMLLFFLLFPLASVLLKQDHIYQNITRIGFLQDEEIPISPQDFTR